MRGIFLGTAAVMVLAPLGAAYAQSGTSGDIIVTARKRQESVLQVPVLESVVTKELLESYKVDSVSDLETRVPGLYFADAPLNNGVQVAIRGAGTSALDAGIDQTVSLNLDGLQLNQGSAYRSALFDVEQVEVLKGPQALFYGKSSTGGVLSIRTADPTDQFEVIGRASYGFQADERRGELIVSGPLSDQLLVRLAGSYSRDDGYFKNTAVALPGLGGRTPTTRDVISKNLVLRGTVLFKPSADFTARLKINHVHDRVIGNGGEGQLASCPDGIAGAPNFIGVPFLGGNEDCKLDRKFNVVWGDPAAVPRAAFGGVPGYVARQTFGTLELNYNVTPEVTLTSLTGYYRIRSIGNLNAFTTTYGPPPLMVGGGLFGRRDFTQEIRVDTEFDGQLNFSGGLYFQDGSIFNTIQTAGNIALPLPAAFGGRFTPIVGDFGRHATDSKAYSAFGQLRWTATPTFEIAGGLRWTDDTRDYRPFSARDNRVIPVAVNHLKNRNLSPELTLTWRPTDDLTVFGSAKQAFKSGSFSSAGLPTAGDNNSFKSERVRGGELGVKGRLADRQVTFELAGYHYKFKDLQVGAVDQPPAGVIKAPGNRVLNAGGAKIYGVDFSVNYSPAELEGLNLNGGVNYNHARFTDYRTAPCFGGQTIEQGCSLIPNPVNGFFTAQDLTGSQLLRAPDWQISAGFSYRFDLSDTLKMTFNSDNRYSSRFLNSLTSRADSITGSHFNADISLALAAKNDAWEIAGGATNLTNKIIANLCTNSNFAGGSFLGAQNTGRKASVGPGLSGVDELSCRANPGRQVWLRLTLKPNLL